MTDQPISNAEAGRLYDQRMAQMQAAEASRLHDERMEQRAKRSAPTALAEGEVAILRLPLPVRAIVAVTQALQLAYGDGLDILTLHDHGPSVMVIARGVDA